MTRRAERRLRHRQGDGRDHVVALAHEAAVGPHADVDVDVAGAAAEHAGVALARQADALAVVDARRHLDLERPLLGHPARRRRTRRTARDDHAARAAAGRAGAGADELAEDAVRDLADAAGAAARWAALDARARLGAARRRTARRSRRRRTGPRRRTPLAASREIDLDMGDHVGPTLAPPSPPQQVVAEEAEKMSARLAEVEVARPEAPAAQAGMAEAVVELSRLALRQHLVRLRHLGETLLRVGRVGDVRVHLARHPAERLLDLVLASVTRDTEHLVVVALRRRHRRPSVAPGPGGSRPGGPGSVTSGSGVGSAGGRPRARVPDDARRARARRARRLLRGVARASHRRTAPGALTPKRRRRARPCRRPGGRLRHRPLGRRHECGDPAARGAPRVPRPRGGQRARALACSRSSATSTWSTSPATPSWSRSTGGSASRCSTAAWASATPVPCADAG